jgi:hypothetical protein
MLFWFAILFGALGAYLAGRKSFYANWTILFNILISIYTSVMLAPVLLAFLSDDTPGIGYNCAAFILIVSVLVFVILQVIARYALLAGEVEVDFPKLIEMIGARVVGFFSGFCVATLIIFVMAIMIMPYSYRPWMSFIRSSKEPVTAVTGPMTTACNFINSASLQRYTDAPTRVLSDLTNLETYEKTQDNDDGLDPEQFPNLLGSDTNP